MEGLESSMLDFILEQAMRMTHEKSLALYLLHILTGLFSPKLFHGFPFSVGTAVSLLSGCLLFCVFRALPRNPEVSSGSGSSGALRKSAFVFSSQRVANAPG